MIRAPMPTMRLAIRLARSPILIILSDVVCCDIFSSSASRGSVSTELIGKVPHLLECSFPFGKRCPGCDRMQAMPHPFSDEDDVGLHFSATICRARCIQAVLVWGQHRV